MMADPFHDNPTGESWADMVEEDEALTHQDQVDQHDPDDKNTTHKVIPDPKETSQDVTKETPQDVTKETPQEVTKETPTGAQASRWASAGPSKSAMSSRWATLSADRSEPPRSSKYGRWQDPYKPTGGRLNRSTFEEDVEDHSGYDRRRGGFDNKENFSKVNRYREYYELNKDHGVPETEETKKAIAAWNDYKPVDDTELKEQDSKEVKVELEKPKEDKLEEKPKEEEKKQDQMSLDKKEEPLEQKANKTLITSGFSWADDMPDQSDNSDNEEEDLLRLSGKSPVPTNEQLSLDSQETGKEESVNEKESLLTVDEKTDKEPSPILDKIKDEEVPTPSVSDKASDSEAKETEVTEKEPTTTANTKWHTPEDDKESIPSANTEKANEEVDQLAVSDENVDKKPMESVNTEEISSSESNSVEEKPSNQWGALEDYKEPTPSTEAQESKEEVIEAAYVPSAPKDFKEETKEALAEIFHEPSAPEENPVYQWGALDDYKDPEPKKPETKSPPKMSKEEEEAKVAAWHTLKVPVDEEDKEEPSSSWNEESEKPVESKPSWNAPIEPAATSWGNEESKPIEEPKVENSWGGVTEPAAASWGSQSVSAEPKENKPSWGQLDDVQTPKKQVVKDTWKNKLQVVDSDNTSGWKSFASLNEVSPPKPKRSPVVSHQEHKQEWQAPSEPKNKVPTWDSVAEETKSWSTTINQIEITQPTPEQRKSHEVSFSLNNFQEEPKQGPQTISLSWKDFTMDNESNEKAMSVMSLDSGEHSTTQQPIRATIALYDKPTSVALKFSDFESNNNSASSAPQISLKLGDFTENIKPVESVHLKLSDFAQTSQETHSGSGLSSSKHSATNINQPFEERNPDKWGSVSDDSISKQTQHFTTETSHPRRKIQMGGMQWANLQKNLFANKK